MSDVQLAQCLYRDLLFRKFCHLELGEDVPEASTLGRFRTRSVEHHLWSQLLAEINRQLEAKHIIMSEGRIISFWRSMVCPNHVLRDRCVKIRCKALETGIKPIIWG